jgi:uncharacterized membrane protein
MAAAFDLLSFVLGDRPAAHDAFIAANYAIVAGAIVSLGTALTGFWDWWKGLDREPNTGPIGRAKHTQVWRTANFHMAVMLTVTAIVIVDIVVRFAGSSGETGVGVLILSLLAGGGVAFGAVYGGSLVYDYQFNVASLKGSTVWDETEEDQFPGQKA